MLSSSAKEETLQPIVFDDSRRSRQVAHVPARLDTHKRASETKKNVPGGLWRHGQEPTAHAPPHVRWRGRLYLKSRVLSERRREESSAVKSVVEDMLCSSFLAAVFDVFIVDIFLHVDKINPWGRRPISLQYFPLPIHLSLRECVRVYEWMNIRVSFFSSCLISFVHFPNRCRRWSRLRWRNC